MHTGSRRHFTRTLSDAKRKTAAPTFPPSVEINFLSFLGTRLTWRVPADKEYVMMLQELYDRWTEIQKQYSEGKTATNSPERISEELNILEALRISGCKAIPGETSDVQVLIDKRYKRLEELLRKRNG